MSDFHSHAAAYVCPEMSARQVYRAVHSYLRLVYGQYNAFDKLALDRVKTFNYFCARSGQQFEAVDAAFRSWEAVGVHRVPNSDIKTRRDLHYRQLAIN